MPMLLVLMYHRVGTGKHANSLELLHYHFQYLKERFAVVLPGDPLPKGKTSICLSFDDASYDFYHYVFPLLKEMDLRALLGVPVRYIREKSDLPAEERLEVPYTLAMQDGFFEEKAPFCTWQELSEMVASGHVEVASHSYAHCNLTFSFVDLEREVIRSKEILQEKLPQAITSFVYPFGRHNRSIQELIGRHYPYSFRIGSGTNYRWDKSPLFRIPADNLAHPTQLFTPLKRLKYFLKSMNLSH